MVRLINLLDITDPAVIALKHSFSSDCTENLPDIFAAIMRASYHEKLEILDTIDLTERFKKILPLIKRQIDVSIFRGRHLIIILANLLITCYFLHLFKGTA